MVKGESSSAGEVIYVVPEAKGSLISAEVVCLQERVAAPIRAVVAGLRTNRGFG